MEKYNELLLIIQSLETDFYKFYEKGQSAAGTRLRKSLNDFRKVAQTVRQEIQETKVSRKEKK